MAGVGALDDLEGEREFLSRPADQAAGVTAIGPDQGGLPVQGVQPLKQGHGRIPVADVRGGHRDDQQQAERVGHDMPFAARHLPPAVVPAR